MSSIARQNHPMPKTPLRAAAAIGGTADDVEAAFYEALQLSLIHI